VCFDVADMKRLLKEKNARSLLQEANYMRRVQAISFSLINFMTSRDCRIQAKGASVMKTNWLNLKTLLLSFGSNILDFG
jgi:hypothetical protein